MEWVIFIAIFVVGWWLESKLGHIEYRFDNLDNELQSIKDHIGLTSDHEEFMREVETDREIQKIVDEGKK